VPRGEDYLLSLWAVSAERTACANSSACIREWHSGQTKYPQCLSNRRSMNVSILQFGHSTEIGVVFSEPDMPSSLQRQQRRTKEERSATQLFCFADCAAVAQPNTSDPYATSSAHRRWGAFARATIRIATASVGTDVAIEAADTALMAR
jgi:hypothetical protein